MILSLLFLVLSGITDTGHLIPMPVREPIAINRSELRPIEHKALDAAESALGSPYVWGSASPDVGFDCSGLTQWAYAQVGVSLPRTSYAQYASAQPTSDPEPGDLVFFRTYGPVSHVGIVAEGGMFIHAENLNTGVRLTPLDNPGWQHRIVGYGTVSDH